MRPHVSGRGIFRVPATAAKRYCPGRPVTPPEVGDLSGRGIFRVPATVFVRYCLLHACTHLVAPGGPWSPRVRADLLGAVWLTGEFVSGRRGKVGFGAAGSAASVHRYLKLFNAGVILPRARGAFSPGSRRFWDGARLVCGPPPVFPSLGCAHATPPHRLPQGMGAHRYTGLPCPGVSSRRVPTGRRGEATSPGPPPACPATRAPPWESGP